MPEPGKAKLGEAEKINVTITSSGSGYSPSPVNSSVDNDGEVYFICSQACWIWTIVNDTLTDAFEDETNNYIPCAPGSNGGFTPADEDETITIVPLAVNSNPPNPLNPKDSVKGTIKVGSGTPGTGRRK
ncbi:MAG: hypothetical protein WCD49_04555 [Candidatus Acidiferrales bacterium]